MLGGAEVKKAMENEILAAAAEGDSVGECWKQRSSTCRRAWASVFDTVEGMLAHSLFAIPAVKGVEFGAGFAFAGLKGSEANDGFAYEQGRIVTRSNNNGGVNGGITNGMPVVFRTVIKPTPSIYKEQQTVDLEKGCNASLTISGRHDPAIIHRARAVVDAVTALVLADLLTVRYGTDYLREQDR